MAEKYERITIPIKDLYLHPNNARFAEKIEFDTVDNVTDKKAIERMIHLENTHMDKLLPDIAQNGILPSLLPITMPFRNEKGKYIVYDANRRLTALKLLVMYKKDIDTFDIPSKFKSLIKKLSYTGPNSLLCMCSDDLDFINQQLTRIHTDDPGISQVKWTPQSKDYHLAEEGLYSNRYILDRFLSCSKYTNDTTKDNLFIRGWRRQIENFINNQKVCEDYFGIKFDSKSGKMILFYSEETIVDVLSHLVHDMIKYKAIKVVQSEEARVKYLNNFKEENPLSLENISNPIIEFNAINSKFEISSIIIENHKTYPTNNISQSQCDLNGTPVAEIAEEELDLEKKNINSNLPKGNVSEKSSTIGADKKAESNGRKRKQMRKFLIEDDHIDKIKDRRAKAIYNELSNLSIGNFPNSSAAAFRSLFDLTIICYLKHFCPDNIKSNNLPENFRKVVSKLEASVSKGTLMKNFPAIYIDIEKIANNEFHSIKILNTIMHNNAYHPTSEEIISIADNYLPFIDYVWDQIK